MDDPRVKLQEALKEAMVKKDTVRRDVIRMALNAVKQVEVDERKALSPEDVTVILQKEVKTRRESIAEAEKAGRAETAAEETSRLAVLESFLPQQMSRDQIAALAREAIAQTGATSAKDIGKVMGVLSAKTKGLADGKLVNEVVREMLST
jgi:uncharacterized protein